MSLPFSSGPQWPPAHFAELMRLYPTGLSARQIAKSLNTQFDTVYSRNAIIGMVRRHIPPSQRVQQPSAPKIGKRPERRPQTPATIRVGTTRSCVLPPSRPLPEPKVFGASAPVDVSRPWLERRYGQCTWIVSGEGADAWSCCAPVKARGWCAEHFRLGTAKPATPAQRQAAARARQAKRRAA